MKNLWSSGRSYEKVKDWETVHLSHSVFYLFEDIELLNKRIAELEKEKERDWSTMKNMSLGIALSQEWLAEKDAKIAELEKANDTLHKLMVSGEKRGVDKANQEFDLSRKNLIEEFAEAKYVKRQQVYDAFYCAESGKPRDVKYNRRGDDKKKIRVVLYTMILLAIAVYVYYNTAT